MTYRRPAGTFAAAWTAIARLVGADALGISASRLRQLSNPMRGDSNVLELAVAADAAAARAGGGTPIFDLYSERLAAAGVRTPHRGTVGAGRAAAASASLGAALALARRLVAALEDLTGPAVQPALVRA